MIALWRWLIGPIAGPVMGVALIAVLIGGGAVWLFQRMEISRLSAANSRLDDAINNPNNGWVRRFDRCETNSETFKSALDNARADIKKLGDDSAKRDADIQAAVGAASRQATAARRSADKLLALPSTAMPGTLASCTAGERFIRGQLP